MQEAIFGVVMFLFFGSVIATLTIISMVAARNKNAPPIVTSILTVTIVDAVMIAILAGISFLYVAGNPALERSYVLIVLHVSLLISIISVSVSTVQQLSATPGAS
jgi:hypothetical protein